MDVKLREPLLREEEYTHLSILNKFFFDTTDESEIPELIVWEDRDPFYSQKLEMIMSDTAVLSNQNMGTNDEAYEVIEKLFKLYKNNDGTIHHYYCLMGFLLEKFHISLGGITKTYTYDQDKSKNFRRLIINSYMDKLVDSNNTSELSVSELIALPVDWQWDLLNITFNGDDLIEAMRPS